MILCRYCRSISFPKYIREKQPEDPFNLMNVLSLPSRFSTYSLHQPSLEALQSSANNGCPLCSKFWAIIKGSIPNGARSAPLWSTGREDLDKICDDEVPPVVLYCWYDAFSFIESMVIRCGQAESNISSHSRYAYPNIPRDFSARPNAFVAYPRCLDSGISGQEDNHTGSEVNLELARIWSRDCFRSHDQCCKALTYRIMPNLPNRVIDIKDLENPRLLETQNQRGHYLTLSYCWGQGNRLLTTKESYETFKRKLPTDDRMPLTFREAFQVTKALGYQYLWIDALCIIQDHSYDLQKEMQKELTDSGLFSCRDGFLHKPTKVVVKTNERDEPEGMELVFVSPEYNDINPLSSRCWVLQEQILARRHLIFTPHEIQWKCKSRLLSETRPWGPMQNNHEVEDFASLEPLPDDHGIRKDFQEMTTSPLDAMRLLVTDPTFFKSMKTYYGGDYHRQDHFDVWYRVVESYSTRGLTVLSDKLLAIAGVAQLMQKHFACEYGAGLWKEDLPMGLCWYVQAPDPEDTFPTITLDHPKPKYVAPSWSWASLTQRAIIFHHHIAWRSDRILEQSAQVLKWSLSYSPESETSFSQVVSGFLTLRGHIRDVLLIPAPQDEDNTPWYPKSQWQIHALDPLTTSMIGAVSLDTSETKHDLIKRYKEIAKSERESAGPRGLVPGALPALCLLTYVVNIAGHRHRITLILVPHDVARQEYRRIGLCYADPFAWHSERSIFGTSDGNDCQNYQIVHIV